MGNWSWVAGSCLLGLGISSGALASVMIPPGENRLEFNSPRQPREPQTLAQGLRGQCRQAYQNIFIYRTRSLSEVISSVVQDERVILAEDSARDGWIAVSSPTTGFVEARYLKLCDRAVSPAPPSLPPLSPPPSTARPNLPSSSVCRRVTYGEPEGMTVRSGPSVDYARVGGVFFGDRVTINPAATQLDSQGREWLRMTSPMNGWISNGFPAFSESNLGACF
jgi:hypothetical protein